LFHKFCLINGTDYYVFLEIKYLQNTVCDIRASISLILFIHLEIFRKHGPQN